MSVISSFEATVTLIPYVCLSEAIQGIIVLFVFLDFVDLKSFYALSLISILKISFR